MSDHRLGELYAMGVNYQRERDEARAEVARWRAKFADQAALLQSADADRDRLVTEAQRLHADLDYERQLHKDANTEVERLRGADTRAEFAENCFQHLSTEVERLRSLLREVAGSGVQLPASPPGLDYATVQIDGELWESLRKEFVQ